MTSKVLNWSNIINLDRPRKLAGMEQRYIEGGGGTYMSKECKV